MEHLTIVLGFPPPPVHIVPIDLAYLLQRLHKSISHGPIIQPMKLATEFFAGQRLVPIWRLPKLRPMRRTGSMQPSSLARNTIIPSVLWAFRFNLALSARYP